MRLKRKIKKLSREIDLKKIRIQQVYYETKYNIKKKMLSPTVLITSLASGFLSVYFLLPLFSNRKKLKVPLRHLASHPPQQAVKGSNIWLMLFTAMQYLPSIVHHGRRLIQSRQTQSQLRQQRAA